MLQFYAAIWRASGRRQIFLIAISLGIAALAAAPLKFQQEIINLLSEDHSEYRLLMFLALGMFGVILLSLSLKWVMGYFSGTLGEDLVRRLRLYLMQQATSEDASNAHVGKGSLATAIFSEAEEVGKFAGTAYTEPVVQIGTLISVVSFITASQPYLGIVALAMILPQVVLVLVTQRQINALVTERIRQVRSATDRITSEELKRIIKQSEEDFDRIYETQRRIFLWKGSTKFLLSLINGTGTVCVLLLGGWLVLEGRTDVGTVVAATLGLDRLSGPTSFLIAFYRQVSVNHVKFEMVRGLFEPAMRSAA